MKYDSLLIENPHSQPRAQRAAWSMVTAVFWLVYLYLWMPLATLVLWFLGVRLAVFELYLSKHQVEPFLLLLLPLLALTAAAMLISWGEFNRWRFRGKDKREGMANISHREVAQAFGATAELATTLQGGKVVMLTMDETATPRMATVTALPIGRAFEPVDKPQGHKPAEVMP
ncbi:poly-beta-1,6-N-acetyl-D-glucosamine biosynthesis protein PgaD [Lysobacter sp. A289]